MEDTLRFRFVQQSFQGRALTREVGVLIFRHKGRFARAAGRIMGALALVLAFAAMRGGGYLLTDPELRAIGGTYMVVISFVWGAALLLIGLQWMGLPYGLWGALTLRRLRGQTGDTRFYESELEDTDKGASIRTVYGNLQALYEGKQAFYLYLDKRAFLILQKKDLSEGEPEAFRRFLREKTKKNIEQVR